VRGKRERKKDKSGKEEREAKLERSQEKAK
jgi:hypothetical protein